MPKRPRQFVSFDWAMKKLLRSKANFDVLEGFLSELLKEDIRIVQLLESESNPEDKADKYNRMDLLVQDARDQRIVIEVQYNEELDYFQRMLYGAAKVITENLDLGKPYADIKRVISVNLLYFDLGQGDDYVFIGETTFTGMHSRKELKLTQSQKDLFRAPSIPKLYPIYYILKINTFNNIAKDGLDEWIYFLKNEQLPKDYHAKGLDAANEKLDIMRLSPAEREEYEQYQKSRHIQASLILLNQRRAEEAEAREKESKAREKKAKAREKEAKAREKEAKAREAQERREKEEAKTREEEAKTREEEAKTREEEAKTREKEAKDHAVRTLAAKFGISQDEARETLGYD